jgi:hypothetical protein
VRALHRMGGVAKTQAEVEYVHQSAAGYDVVWIAAERAGLIGEQVAALAGALGCARPGPGLAEARRAVAGSCGSGGHGDSRRDAGPRGCTGYRRTGDGAVGHHDRAWR